MANTDPVADTAGVVEQVFHLGQRQGDARGRVRVREDDAAVVSSGQQVIHAQAEILGQRHWAGLDAVELGVNRVKAVRDVREEQRRVVLQQAHEGVGQHLVRTIADEHLGHAQAVVTGDGFFERQRLRVGIEAQGFGVVAADGGQQYIDLVLPAGKLVIQAPACGGRDKRA